MKVAILGPEGTYTHQAAHEYFGEKLEPVFYSTIKDIFEAGEQNKIVPIENTLGGDVEETIEQFRERKNLRIQAEQRIPINHCLISNEKLENIDKVKSHPQALSQCKNYIEEHGWEQAETGSTAQAVEDLNKGEAAIASEIAAKTNQTPIVEKGIQDNGQNRTRFFIVSKENDELKTKRPNQASMILEPEADRPGLLHEMLEKFANHDINLTHIQSRPKKTRLGEYYFYLEAEIPKDTNQLDKALEKTQKITKTRLLGKYPVNK